MAIGAITLSVEDTVWIVTGAWIKGSPTFLSAFQGTLNEV